MASEVIKEYLISLGYKIDSVSMARFSDSLGRATTIIGDFGIKTLGVTTAAAIGMIGVTERFNDLYFAAQRTGSSVNSLKSFAFGLKQVGVSSDEAWGMLQKLNVSTFSNPMMKNWIESFFHVKVDLNDTEKTLVSILGSMRNMPAWYQAGAASRMGWDMTTVNVILKNFDKIQEAMGNYNERRNEAGLDYDKLSGKAHVLWKHLNELGTEIGFIPEQIAKHFLPGMTDLTKGVDNWSRALVRMGKETDGVSSIVAILLGLLLAGKSIWWVIRALLSILRVGAATRLGAAVAGIGGAAFWEALFATAGIADIWYHSQAGRGEQPIYDKQGQLTEYGRKVMEGVKRGETSFAPNAPPTRLALDQARVTSSSGKGANVSSPYAPYFQYFLEQYEKSGGKVNALGGQASGGHIPGSKHGWGGAIDLNEYGAGGKRTAGALPENLEDKLAAMAGLYPGSHFKSNYDPGHFEVSRELEAWVAGGGTFEAWKKAHEGKQNPDLHSDTDRPDPIDSYYRLFNKSKLYQHSSYVPEFDEMRLSPGVQSSTKVAVTQSNSIVAHGTPGPEREPTVDVLRLSDMHNDTVRYSMPSLV